MVANLQPNKSAKALVSASTMLTRLVAIVTLIQAVCYVNCNNLHHYGSHACGSDHEDVQTLERAAVTVPLAYRPPVAATLPSRRAQAAFVTVGEADAVGATARIRIHVSSQCSGSVAEVLRFSVVLTVLSRCCRSHSTSFNNLR